MTLPVDACIEYAYPRFDHIKTPKPSCTSL